jgi:hypothetical protein
MSADLHDFDDEPPPHDTRKLEAIYEEFRKRGDAPECLREYLYEKLGRCLP